MAQAACRGPVTNMGPLDNLTVRPARHPDIETIVSFSAAMALETEGRHLDRAVLKEGTEALVGAPDRGMFFVAEIGHRATVELVGQLMITYEWSDWRNAAFWWIQSVYVTPSWRRRGVYRRMHETVLARARGAGRVCGVRLYVDRDNTVAQRVYERVGLSPSSYRVYEEDFVLPRAGVHTAG